MKKYIYTGLLAVLLTACNTLNTGVVTLTAVVDSAMKNWASLSTAGKTSQSIDNQVIAAHDKNRAACAVAQQSLITYKASGDQTAFIQAFAAAKVAATGLIDIILPLVTKSTATTLSVDLAKANTL